MFTWQERSTVHRTKKPAGDANCCVVLPPLANKAATALRLCAASGCDRQGVKGVSCPLCDNLLCNAHKGGGNVCDRCVDPTQQAEACCIKGDVVFGEGGLVIHLAKQASTPGLQWCTVRRCKFIAAFNVTFQRGTLPSTLFTDQLVE